MVQDISTKLGGQRDVEESCMLYNYFYWRQAWQTDTILNSETPHISTNTQ